MAASEFDDVAYEFRNAAPITDPWRDVDQRNLVGGEVEVEVGKAFVRVAYANNGDGTQTVGQGR